jgi:hypothetical protein
MVDSSLKPLLMLKWRNSRCARCATNSLHHTGRVICTGSDILF